MAVKIKNLYIFLIYLLVSSCSIPIVSESEEKTEKEYINYTDSTVTHGSVIAKKKIQVDSFFFGNLQASDLKRMVIEKNGLPDSTERIDLNIGDNLISEWYYYKSYSILFENANDPESTISIIKSSSKKLSFSSGLPRIGGDVSLLRPFFSTLEFEKLVSKKVGRIPFYDDLQGLDTWLVIEVDSNLVKSMEYNNTSF
jgi:hypothetical protein